MNFLAHCSLAHDAALTWQCGAEERQGLLAGAVIGDFVKGRLPRDWPVALQAGARLHRKVDALSNLNPGIRQNCDRFPQHMRRFAPIFVDMLADHCLALTWQDYYDMSPEAFSTECYDAISRFDAYLSADARRFFNYMLEADLLASYHQWPHIARGLKSVLRRLRREPWFTEVEQASLAMVPDTRADFRSYFPELRGAWQSWDAFEAIAAPQS